MPSTLRSNLRKFGDDYLKFLLVSLLLVFRSCFSLLLYIQAKAPVAALLESLGLVFIILVPIFLLVEKRPFISTSILIAMCCIIIASSISPIFIPIELFLLFPVYRLSLPKVGQKGFVAFVLLITALLMLFQGHFLPEQAVLRNMSLVLHHWLISILAVGSVITVYFDLPKVFLNEHHVTDLFTSVSEYSAVINAVDIGLWSWDIFDNIFKITHQGANLMGVENHENEMIISFHGFAAVSQSLHSGDKEVFRNSLFDLSNGKSEHFEIIVRAAISREKQLWLKIKACRQDDISGQPVRINGSIIDITQHINFERQSQFYDSFDPLTNLPNKKSITQQINALIESKPSGDNANFAVLLLNIDRFNTINESLGRSVGDDLLKTFAQRLEKCMRLVDGVAKLSEDSFIILVTEVKSIQNIYVIVERLQERIQMPFWIQRNEIYLTASVGISIFHQDISSADDMIQEAEIAMFNAKSMGKGKQVLYNESMREKVTKRHQLERDLRKAIDNQEFELYFQPILSLKYGTINGVEALIRWHHPSNGMINPSDFIPIAEETGMIIPIGEWVLESACHQLAEVRKRYPQSSLLTISVNLSAAQLTANLVDKVKHLLSVYNLSGSSLILEITESTVMSQSETVSKLIKDLRALKVRLHIDDFGTGYSSFRYLQDFPVDSIKIDRSFINQLENNHNNYEIVRTVVNLAHELGMTAIAEGVETETQLRQLQKFGCESIQGYLISKPVPYDQLLNMLNYASFETYAIKEEFKN